MSTVWRGGAACLVVGLSVVLAQAEDRKAETIDDAAFIKKAASGNMAEVKLGKVAQESATTTEVKRFAQKVVKDHTNAQSDLAYAARSAGVKFPEGMSKEHDDHLAKFKKMDGKKFDGAYIRHMVKGHEEAVELYQKAGKSVKDTALRKYIEKSLPIIREHLASARKLGEMLGVKDEKRRGD